MAVSDFLAEFSRFLKGRDVTYAGRILEKCEAANNTCFVS